jgi:hypothetical protein
MVLEGSGRVAVTLIVYELVLTGRCKEIILRYTTVRNRNKDSD